MKSSQAKEEDGQYKDGDADIGNLDHVIDHPGPIKPARRGQRPRLRAKDILGQLLQRDGNPEVASSVSSGR